MAKWFKEFPINLRNGPDRSRSSSGSGSQSRVLKTGLMAKTSGPKLRKNSSSDTPGGGGGGVGSLLSGKARKNSASEVSKTGGGSPKDGRVWDLLSGRSRRVSRGEPVMEEQHRPPLRGCPSANAYINRMIRVDKPDKQNPTGPGPEPERPVQVQVQGGRTETVIILEDYADPFDAQKKQRGAERTGENDGYMEPYDAQQMITEIRRRGSRDLLKVCVLIDVGEGSEEGQTDDTPQEGSGNSDRISVGCPELDPRPNSEYELPWERKKDQIFRTLSAQFDASERPAKDEPPHPTLSRTPQHPTAQRQKSWSQKILRSAPVTPSASSTSSLESEACSVDPSLPLEEQSWYHGCVTRQEAELQLQACREASFLVRNIESDNSKYSIALKTSQGCVHIIIARTRGSGYTLDQSSCVFPSIPEVVRHYCARRLPFDGAAHMTLLHPVSRLH